MSFSTVLFGLLNSLWFHVNKLLSGFDLLSDFMLKFGNSYTASSKCLFANLIKKAGI